ncbi:cation transporter [Rufibacter immobilis]|nr:cation transporter [Rufibacter immobilis]
MVRMKLDEFASIQQLDFDLSNRKLTVYHTEETNSITQAINQLNLDSREVETEELKEFTSEQNASHETKILWAVLLINLVLFVVEMVTGIISKSMGLVADSLDMLADTLVYGLSLYAIGRAAAKKKAVAKFSGFLQLGLAVLGFIEVIRRFIGGEALPDFKIMIGISLLALLGNTVSLYLLNKTKSQEAHIQASSIFTSNDIIINIGVIAAALLVYFTESSKPDLIIGAIVFVIVTRGAFRILKLSK